MQYLLCLRYLAVVKQLLGTGIPLTLSSMKKESYFFEFMQVIWT